MAGTNNKKAMLKTEADQILVIDNTEYKTRLTGKFINRKKWEKPDKKKLFSFIPGTILKVYVKKGQKVKRGEKVLILEAMKMQNKILLPVDGVIRSVNVKEGQNVPKGELLIELK